MMSICLHLSEWLLLDRILWNLVFMTFMKICQENNFFLENRKNTSGALHEESSVLYIFGSDICRVKIRKKQSSFSILEFSICIFFDVETGVSKIQGNAILLFYGNDSYVNQRQYYVTHVLPLLLTLITLTCVYRSPAIASL